ncbi:hypothetical protein BDV06DRAFT_153832 [Aspergillus oleicola]
MSAPIAAVVGALGAQGSSVVSALLTSGSPYGVRALTSNAASPDAVTLSSKDPRVEVVQTDLLSIDSLVAAFTGATYIFANTVFRPDVFINEGAMAAQELESTHGLNIVRAAAKVSEEGNTLKHVIWSTLPDTDKASGGKLQIPHFGSKIPAEKFLLDQANGLKSKTTFLRVGMYGSNLQRVPYSPAFVEGAGKYIVTLPCSASTPIPMIGKETPNVGLIVDATFRQPQKSLEKYVVAAAEYLTAKEWVGALSRACGRDIVFLETSLQAYEDLWGSAGTEIGLMMKYIEELGEESFTVGVDKRDILTPEDLGIQKLLGSTEDALRELDWQRIVA